MFSEVFLLLQSQQAASLGQGAKCVIVMAALHSRCQHYIFVLWFLLSIFFFLAYS